MSGNLSYYFSPDMRFFAVSTAVKTAILAGSVMGLTAVLTWVERKQSAFIQDRIGPERADILGFTLWGLFHPVADAIKLVMKEDFVPAKADKTLFALAPIINLVSVFGVLAVIPFGDHVLIMGRRVDLVVAAPSMGLLYAFALSGFAIYGPVLGGWASRNNFAFLGALRGAAQMISYEVVLGLSLVGPMMVYGTADLQEMVRRQGGLIFGFLPAWGIFLQFPAFLLFLTAAQAANRRTPFDVVEGEAEIIGYFLEYSSMLFGSFMFAEFMEIIMIAMLTSAIFLGGWQIPYLNPSAGAFAEGSWPLAILQGAAFAVKTAFMCWVLIAVRWTVPRFRFDQIMKLAWKRLLPLTLANIFVTGLVLIL